MFALLCVSAVLLQLSFGANTVDECFDKSSSSQVDDSKFPPYNTFVNQLDANACKRACLDQNDKGILVADGGAKTAKYCQLACSRQGICKLYYQPELSSGSSGRRRRDAYGPSQPTWAQQPQQPQYGNQGGQQQWGPRTQDQGNQGNAWGPSRTQGGGYGNQGGAGGSGGDQCWKLKSGCPGYGGVSGTGPTNNTNTTGANAKCFNNNLKNKGVKGFAMAYLLGPSQFDETLNGCEGQCLQNALCKSVNFFEKTATDPGECVLHSGTCIEGDPKVANCISTDPEKTDYWQRIPDCKP